MKLIFTYNKEKDVWCLLNKGRSSNNSKSPTKVYERLASEYGENPTKEQASKFIDAYLTEKNINLEEEIRKLENSWDVIKNKYQERAEKIFGVKLPSDITVYLTINNRCPYDVVNNSFFVSLSNESPTKTIMHELWHFYTWYGLGADQLKKLGSKKYNDLKESLTVLLDIECKDLLPEGVEDVGYPQHQEIRKRIVELWSEEKDIRRVWEILAIYWFKCKLYGFGWTPARWQGWLVLGIYIVALALLSLTVDDNSPDREIIFTFILPVVLLSITLIRICYKKGEKPRWQWGHPKEKK